MYGWLDQLEIHRINVKITNFNDFGVEKCFKIFYNTIREPVRVFMNHPMYIYVNFENQSIIDELLIIFGY